MMFNVFSSDKVGDDIKFSTSKLSVHESVDNESVKLEGSSNVLRKSKSEKQNITTPGESGKVPSKDVMMSDHELPRRLSSEAVDISEVKDSEDQNVFHNQEKDRKGSKSISLNDGDTELLQFATRSRTPGFLLDDESDWTIMMDGISSKGDNYEGQSRNTFSRPSTAFGGLRRPYTPAGMHNIDVLLKPIFIGLRNDSCLLTSKVFPEGKFIIHKTDLLFIFQSNLFVRQNLKWIP